MGTSSLIEQIWIAYVFLSRHFVTSDETLAFPSHVK